MGKKNWGKWRGRRGEGEEDRGVDTSEGSG